MNIVCSSKKIANLAQIIFVCKTDAAEVVPGIHLKEFDASANSTLLLHEKTAAKLYVGLGCETSVTELTVRNALGTAVRKLQSVGISEAQWEVGAYKPFLTGAIDAAIVAAYEFDCYKPESSRRIPFAQLTLLGKDLETEDVQAAVAQGMIYGDAVNLVRRIGNEPGNVCTPEYIAEQAQALAAMHDLNCEIFKKKELKEKGFEAILAVGGGSVNAPRLITLQYEFDEKAPTVAIVGKAITFDSGGISIKPAATMEEMKWDKMGGVGVLGIMDIVARLKLPVNVVGIICSAENMPGGESYRPGDIIKTYSGKTVEVINTDAEGRMVLCDGLAYAVDEFAPDCVMDMATLTGACCVALGLRRTGVFSTDSKASHALHAIGERTGDRCWGLPMGEEYLDPMKGHYTDLINSASSRYGSASFAASFLNEFVGQTPHIHLDIAGTGWLLDTEPYLAKGATGAGVRLVAEFLKDYH